MVNMLKISLEALEILDAIARHGSFGRAAVELGRVPSAVTYAVRKLEDDLDTLIFDRSGYRAELTETGKLLLEQGRELLSQADHLELRIAQAAKGWELELNIVLDAILPWSWLQPHVEAYFQDTCSAKLRINEETLAGSWDALLDGRADLVIGASSDPPAGVGISSQALFNVDFRYCVAPGHPLASVAEPLSAEILKAHRAVAVGDSSRHLPLRTSGLLSGQDTLVVPSMQAKIDAQVAGLGAGYLATWFARPYLSNGTLVSREVAESKPAGSIVVAWKSGNRGRALAWWRERLRGAIPPK
jgi:DNA-binding transcriptional LysR family regulator